LLFEFFPDEGKPGYLQGETMKWKEGLEFVINTDSPGEVIVAMRAESIGGKSDFAKTTLKVEGYTKEEQGFVDNAKKLTPQDLVGKWRWHGLKDGRWQPLPAYTEIAPAKSDPKVLTAQIHNPTDPNWKVATQVALLDTRVKPTLRLLSLNDQGRPVEDMNFTVLVSRWEQGSPRLVLKYLVPKGWLLLWAKEKDGQASAPAAPAATASLDPQPAPATLPPAPTTPPEPAASLVGVWQSQDGEVLKIGPSTYEVYSYQQLMDKGTYELKGKLIVIQSSLTGERERLSYRLQGQQLTLKDSDGETSNYQKIQ
jgi:hypothetical protein